MSFSLRRFLTERERMRESPHRNDSRWTVAGQVNESRLDAAWESGILFATLIGEKWCHSKVTPNGRRETGSTPIWANVLFLARWLLWQIGPPFASQSVTTSISPHFPSDVTRSGWWCRRGLCSCYSTSTRTRRSDEERDVKRSTSAISDSPAVSCTDVAGPPSPFRLVSSGQKRKAGSAGPPKALTHANNTHKPKASQFPGRPAYSSRLTSSWCLLNTSLTHSQTNWSALTMGILLAKLWNLFGNEGDFHLPFTPPLPLLLCLRALTPQFRNRTQNCPSRTG